MENIFDIVSSLIPDEQKADIEAKLGGAVESIVKGKVTDVKKELSSKYKVNLFEEDLTKAYTNDNFVAKVQLDEINKNLYTANEELTKYKEQVDALTLKQEEFTKKDTISASSLHLVSNGFRPDRLHLINAELTGDNEKDLGVNKEKYPEMFQESQGNKNPFGNGKNPKQKTEAELYFEEKRKLIKER